MMIVRLGCAVLLLAVVGCGKHEGEQGTAGAVAGGALGAVLAGRHDRGTGALVGAAVGNFVGRTIGSAMDVEEASEKKEQKIESLEHENRQLKRAAEHWCPECCKKVSLQGARRCPTCGATLATKKMCRECHAEFAPYERYSYCPFCIEPVRLSAR